MRWIDKVRLITNNGQDDEEEEYAFYPLIEYKKDDSTPSVSFLLAFASHPTD